MEPWRFYGSVVLDSHHIDKELDADPQPCWRHTVPSVLRIWIQIQIPRIRMFLHFLNLDSDPLVRGIVLLPENLLAHLQLSV